MEQNPLYDENHPFYYNPDMGSGMRENENRNIKTVSKKDIIFLVIWLVGTIILAIICVVIQSLIS